MKAYLIITGSLFALLAATHALRLVEEFSSFSTQPWFVTAMISIVIVCATLSVWAWRLLRQPGRG
jgi:hypothetical protein